MCAFLISEAALIEIRRIFDQSRYPNPVARIFERADVGSLFDDVKNALLEGEREEKNIVAIARGRFHEIEGQLNSSIAVGVHESNEFQPEHIREVDGVSVVLNDEIATMLHGFRLTFEHGHFFLRDRDNAVHSLRSLVGRSGESSK